MKGNVYLVEGDGFEKYVYVTAGEWRADVYQRDGAFCTVSTEKYCGAEPTNLIKRVEEIPLYTLINVGMAGVEDVISAVREIDLVTVAERMYRTGVMMVCRRSGMMYTAEEVEAAYGVDLFELRTVQQLKRLILAIAKDDFKETDYSLFTEVYRLVVTCKECPEAVYYNVKGIQMLLSYYSLCL